MDGKHAYLIMAHNRFDQLGKLIKALDDKRNDIFIHIDKKNKNLNSEICRELKDIAINSHILIYNDIYVYWSDYSQVECELYLLQKATEVRRYQYYHLISGQDFPIKSQKYIHSFFDKNNGKEFVDYQKIFFNNHKLLILDRVKYYHPFRKYCRYFQHDILNKLFRGFDKIAVISQKIAKIDRCKKNNLDICFGVNWFSITDSFARYILKNKDFIEKNFKYTNCPDELFIQTLLKSSCFIRNLYHETIDDFYGNMRLVDFQRGNPYTYRCEDIEEIRNSKYLFLRKVDEKVDSELINLIEELWD